jgi:ribulose-5-phosphate 4-epimerase/fuculose-1-phosphate aldolase
VGGDRLGVVRKYAIWGTPTSAAHEEWVREIGKQFEHDDFVRVDDVADADFVLNMFDAEDPKAFRRAARGTYSAAFYELSKAPVDALKESYPMLVRTLSNVVLLRVPGEGVWFTTMERGTYHVADDPKEIYARLEPLATSRLVIDNVEEYLSGRDLRHVMRLYSVGGLSYGNLSARKDETRFWMSASGVDKSQLQTVGRDLLMVKDFDDERGVIVLSVPPGIEPRRVSVDAIEHWMIYQAHPDVGAILHVHAWMEGIAATDVNYPCGTQELAVAVSDLVAMEPDPAHAVIGLRNHGITCTGESLAEILDQVAPKVLRQVPMT